MDLIELLKDYDIANEKDIECVFGEVSTGSRVFIRHVNGGPVDDFDLFAEGPYLLKKDELGYLYIVGYDRRDRQEKHLRIADDKNMPGIVELRAPNHSWIRYENGSLRLYVRKAKLEESRK